MRKIAAILLLFVFTFNIIGYQFVYNYYSQQSDAVLELALDENKYDDSQLISIKQPTNLPYYTNSKAFSRIDGEIEIDGTTYKYVKCRIYNDSLEMMCIPHVAKMKIQQSKQVYAKVANDFQHDSSQKKNDNNSKSFQKQLSEYEDLQYQIHQNQFVIVHSNFALYNVLYNLNHIINTVEQPPEVAIAA